MKVVKKKVNTKEIFDQLRGLVYDREARMKLDQPKIKIRKIALTGTEFQLSFYEHQRDFFLDGDGALRNLENFFKPLRFKIR